MKRIVLFGGGRMGHEVAQVLEQSPDTTLAAVVCLNRPDWLEGIPWYNDLDQLEESPDLVIDFTLPGGTARAAEWCRANLVPILSGTTGLGDKDRDALQRASELIPVLWAPNLSRAVNILMLCAVEAAAALPTETPVEITDVHHADKQDAPSGTALLLARAIAAARDQELEACLHVRESAKDGSYPAGSINCISLREGSNIGEHSVRFHCPGETLTMSHGATDRGIYARGAMAAGFWLISQEAGLYSAADWLND